MNANHFKKIFLILLYEIITTSVLADDKMDLGLEIFNNKAQCGMCHTLKSAKSSGTIGPNLDDLKPQKTQIISVVKNGIGVMPAFEGILSIEEMEAVAYYVFISSYK